MAVSKKKTPRKNPSLRKQRSRREFDLSYGNEEIRRALDIYAMTGNGAFAWSAIHTWAFLRLEYDVQEMPKEIAKYLQSCALAISDHVTFSRKNQLQILADMGLRNPKGGASLAKQTQRTSAALSKVEQFQECVTMLGMKPSEAERFLAPHFDTTPAALHQLVLKWKRRANKAAAKSR